MKVHKFRVDKLIRDRVPEILRGYGITVYERSMDDQEYLRKWNSPDMKIMPF